MKKLSTNNVIDRCKKIHSDKNYDFSKINWIDYNHPITITCLDHNYRFDVLLNNFLKYKCCCHKSSTTNKRYSKDEIINICNKIHNFKYDYSLLPNKIELTKKIKIICKKCNHIFEQSLHKHKNKRGCPKCSKNNKIERFKQITKSNILSNENFIEKCKLIHNNLYNYNKTNYTRMRNIIIISCPIHGDFEQKATYHINGSGCPNCKTSKGENKIIEYLKTLNIDFISQKRFNNCKNKIPLPFDFYLPKYNTCIEYDGEMHTKSIFGKEDLKQRQINDQIKNEYCKENNIHLIRIPYWDFKNIEIILKNIIV